MESKKLTDEVCADERLNQTNSFEEVTYYRLVACCDSRGKVDGRIKVLLPKLYPLRMNKVTEERLERALDTLLILELIAFENKNKSDARITIKGWKQTAEKTEPTTEQIAMFETFWKAYPRRVAKDKALLAFVKTNPTHDKTDAMVRAIESQSKTEEWTPDRMRYVPHPTTWLNQKRWTDETAGKKPSSAQDTRSGIADESFFAQKK